MRKRSVMDMVVIMLATGGTGLLADDAHNRLLFGLVALSLGILIFVIRRSRDVTRLVEAGRWRDDAIVGHGITLAEWHAGVPLPEWSRRSAADAPLADAPSTQVVRDVQNGKAGAEFGAWNP